MKNERQIKVRLDALKVSEKEILKRLNVSENGTFSYRIQYDRITEVRKRISDLNWVLNIEDENKNES